MRNLKKVLSVLLVVAMLATSMVTAFAADTISADAKICADIGMLIGAGDGVTTEYTATNPSRIQAAVMLLRLKGKADEAAKFDGKENFADVKGDEWFAPYTAYLKANASIGFNGYEDGKFLAEEAITAQQYYKVILTALGYEVGEGKDYKYEDTITFAASKGLSKVASVTEYTVNDLAIATVEGLKATVKGGTKTLATVLVEAKDLDAAKAQAAGIYNPYVALDVKSVAAYTNTKVQVNLNTAATIVDATKFSAKDEAGTALEVKGTTLSSDSKVVYVSTAAQTANTLYVLTIDGKDYKFVGQPADSTKPQLSTAVATKNTAVKVSFNEAMDKATAENAANYAIDGLAVLKAVLQSNSTDVVLTTAAQTQGTIYKVVVTNVADIAGNVVNSDYDEAQFGGLAPDTTKPQLTGAVASTNTSVVLSFNEDMNEATAENVANYTIDGLSVLKADLDTTSTSATYLKKVTLTTSAQTQGTIYKVVVVNVTDDSANVINSDNDEFQFGGLAPDTTKPKLTAAVASTNVKVKLTFDEDMDEAIAENIANYAIDGLTIVSAELQSSKKEVVLVTSAQTQGTIYKVVVTNVTDLSANVINSDNDEFQFGGLAADTTKPTVTLATSIDNKTVKVTFSEVMDATTATQAFNYYLGSELGYPSVVAKDTVVTDGTVWVLTTKTQDSKVYTVDVTGVLDLSGNAVNADSDTATFGGTAAAGDSTAPKVASAVALNINTVFVSFNEEVDEATAETVGNYAFTVSTGTETATSTIGAAVYANAAMRSSDKKSVTLQFTTATMSQGVIYKVTVANVKDAAGNVIGSTDNYKTFAGLTSENPVPQVSSAVLLNNQTLQILFSEPVEFVGTLVSTDVVFTDGSAFTGTFVDGKLSSDKKMLTVYYTGTAATDKFVYGPLYTVTLNAARFTDTLGLVTLKSDKNTAKFAAIASAPTAPKISAVIAVDANTVDVIFDQVVKGLDTFSNTAVVTAVYDGSATVANTVYKVRAEGDTNTKLRVFFGSNFTAGKIYKIQIDNALILNNNNMAMAAADNNKTFAAISTANAAPKLVSATATANTEVKVVFSEKVTNVDSTDFAIAGLTVTGATLGSDGKTVTLTTTAQTVGTVYTADLVDASDINDEAGVGAADKATTVKFAGK